VSGKEFLWDIRTSAPAKAEPVLSWIDPESDPETFWAHTARQRRSARKATRFTDETSIAG
jgi:hypothetical protein